MSKLHSALAQHPLTTIGDTLVTALENEVGQGSQRDTIDSMFSMESLDATELNHFASSFQGVTANLEASLEGLLEGMDQAQRAVALESATYAALASADSKGFLNKFKSTATHAPEGAQVIDGTSFEGADYINKDVSWESFDGQKLDEYRQNHVIFNCLAAVGDPFSEAFYPTHNVAPGETGWSLSVKQEVILRDTTRDASGKVTDFGKTRIIDALRDHTILESNAAVCIPAVNPDDSNKPMFVDPVVFPRRSVVADGQTIVTGPLSLEKKVDLIALSSGYGEIAGQKTNHTDQLDPRLNLKALAIQVQSGAPGSEVYEGIELPVLGLPGTDFVNSVNGEGRGMTLNFSTDALGLDVNNAVKNDKTAVAGLADVFAAGYTLNISVQFSAEANLEYGSISPMGRVEIHSAVKDGEVIALTDATLAPLLENIVISLKGYEVDGRRTNTNLRNRGKTCDTSSRTQHYTMPFGAPLHVLSPVDGSAAGATNGVGLSSLVNLASVRSANNAVSALERQAAQLKGYQKGQLVEGILQHVVNPTYIEAEFDALTVVNAQTSAERAECLKQALVDMIRVTTYDLARDSQYRTALELESGQKNAKLETIIGTDENIVQHLMVTGDDRTMSVGVDKFRIVTTPDLRMYDTIYIALGCGREGGLSPFNHGTRGYMPAPTTEMEVNRDGSTVKETIVRPRDLHVNNVPVLAKIKCKNIAEYLGKGSNVLVSSANEPNPA